MSNIALIGSVVSAAVAAPNQAKKGNAVADISGAIQKFGSIPTGYNGAEGKVVAKKGAIQTTGVIEGTDAGFFVEFKPVEVKGAKYLSVSVKGNIFQQQGWDHYASIQVKDAEGKRFILLEVCKEGKFGSCDGKSITKPNDLKKGTTLNIKLPPELKTVQRLEVVFIGATKVEAGFILSNIKLVK
ncbi:MAG: hypothetical protein KKA31_00130 [Candidatus Margulisbacteria bacterium]|nr:hypothetical protein [Candidatus Margulisiibacteriota bacterium]